MVIDVTINFFLVFIFSQIFFCFCFQAFFEILSNVLVAQERSLSFTYGRPDFSCSSLTLMYLGKRRASRINLF